MLVEVAPQTQVSSLSKSRCGGGASATLSAATRGHTQCEAGHTPGRVRLAWGITWLRPPTHRAQKQRLTGTRGAFEFRLRLDTCRESHVSPATLAPPAAQSPNRRQLTFGKRELLRKVRMVSGAAAANVTAGVACARALRARGSGGGGHPGEMPRVPLGPCWAAGGHLLPPSLGPFLRPQGERVSGASPCRQRFCGTRPLPTTSCNPN